MRSIIIAVFLALSMIPVYASPPEPTNTINNPRIVLHKNKRLVQIKWYQYVQSSPKRVIAFKGTNIRQSASIVCTDSEWTQLAGFKYCYMLFNQRLSADQWITATDNNWHKEDRYYILQYEFTSHNAPYGPYDTR